MLHDCAKLLLMSLSSHGLPEQSRCRLDEQIYFRELIVTGMPHAPIQAGASSYSSLMARAGGIVLLLTGFRLSCFTQCGRTFSNVLKEERTINIQPIALLPHKTQFHK